jgi:fatty-acyl-CoA synthase
VYHGAFVARTPDKPAIIMSDTGRVLTNAELEDRSVRLSRLLHEHGLRPGDHVALLAPNSPLYYEVYWATMRSGLYITVINHSLSPAEAAYIVTDCGARAFIVAASIGDIATELVG